jgi:hypothetical protein
MTPDGSAKDTEPPLRAPCWRSKPFGLRSQNGVICVIDGG